MKNNTKGISIILMVFMIIGFSSCENDKVFNSSLDKTIYEDYNISVKSNADKNLINNAENQTENYKNQIINFLNISNKDYSELIWDDYQSINLIGENVNSISKKVVVNKETFLLSFIIDDMKLKSPFITKVKVDKTIEYYFLELNEALSVKNNQVSIIPIDYNSVNAKSFRLKSLKSDCGQAVMNCINDAYNNHGWTSVFAWIAGVFVPQTAAGIAAACTAKNCLNHCGCPIVDGKPQR